MHADFSKQQHSIVHPHPQYTRVLISSCSCQYFSLVFKNNLLMGVRGCLLIVPICCSPTTKDAEHFFMGLRSTCTSSMESPLLIFKIDFVFGSRLKESVNIFYISVSYQIYSLQMFSPILKAFFFFSFTLDYFHCSVEDF